VVRIGIGAKPGLCAMCLSHRPFFLCGVLRARCPFPLPNRRAVYSSVIVASRRSLDASSTLPGFPWLSLVITECLSGDWKKAFYG